MTPNAVLVSNLIRWERRRRWLQVLRLSPRLLIAAWIAGAVFVLIAARMGASVTLAAVAVPSLLIVGGLGGLVWRMSRSLETTARYFDRVWHLQERLSTALEIYSGRIADNTLTTLQLADAEAVARRVDARKQLPLRINWREWVLVAVALTLFIAAWLVAPSLSPVRDPLNVATRAAVESATTTLETIITELAQNTTLDATVRDGLLATLETRLDALQQSPLTADEAFAALNEARDSLASAAQPLQTSADRQASALEQAATALNPTSSNAGSLADALRDPQITNADQAANMQQAAEALASSFPEAAQALQQAADTLQSGAPSVQEALENAAQQAEEAANQQSQSQQAADQLQQASQQMQNSAQQIAQTDAASRQDTQSAPNDPSQAGSQPQDSQSGQPEDGASGDPSQAGSQPQDSASGDPSQAGSQPQDGQNGQPQDGASSDPSQASNQSGQPQDGASSDPSQAGSQSGQPQDGQSQNSATSPTQPETAGDNAGSRESSDGDGVGERAFDPIYTGEAAPISATDNEALLEGDASSAPIQPGDTMTTPQEQTTVPYNQVFEVYAQQAGRALEASVIPSGLQNMVRDYFNALAP